MLGLAISSKTTQNMIRTGQCVLNIPSVHEVAAVNRLAITTGVDPVPDRKRHRGYRFEPDKFGVAGLTPVASETVAAPRVQECPVQLEATVDTVHAMAEVDPAQRGLFVGVDVSIRRVHAEEAILVNYPGLKPGAWR
ncbi:MAG: flavin reductase family protein [Acidiferrobacter sp.]